MEKYIPLKIAIVSGSHFDYQKGGSEYQLLLLGKHLVSQKNKVYYIFRNKKKVVRNSHGMINLAYPVVRVFSFLFGRAFFPYAFHVWKLLRKVQPQMILVRPGNALVGICALYCKHTNSKMIWHIAGKYDVEKFTWALRPRLLTQLIERKILDYGINNSQFIIGQAAYQKSLLLKNFKRDCDIIIPNFHPLNKFGNNKDFQIINVLWIANYKKNKQPEIFVRLAQEMNTYPRVKFYMAGRPDQDERLSRKIRETKNLEHLGELSTEQVLQLMKHSHILINTSVSEGYPNTFIQAWLNKMVVLSLHVNPDDVLTHFNLGYESRSYENMKINLINLINDSQKIVSMGNKAYEFATERHSLRNLVNYQYFIMNAWRIR